MTKEIATRPVAVVPSPPDSLPGARGRPKPISVNKLLAAAVVAGIIAGCSWLGWDSYQDWRGSQAADLYHEMAALVGDQAPGDDSLALLEQLQRQHPDSAYYDFGGLLVVSAYARVKKYEEAIKVMRSVLARSEQEILSPVLNLRLGRLMIAADRMDEALTVFKNGAVFSQPYIGLILEHVGNIHSIRGDKEEARKAYGEAVRAAKEFNRPVADLEILEMKLNDLQGTIAAPDQDG